MFSSKIKIALILILAVILTAYFFDKGLFFGLILIGILSGATFFVINKLGLKDKKIYWLFLVVLSIHLGATLFMYYAHFQPFSGGYGDYGGYQKQAQEIAQRVQHGNFSFQGMDIPVDHYYPVIVGYIYAFTVTSMLVGQLFNVWLAVISIIFIYLIVLEIGGSKTNAFIIGLISAVYPSYLFYTGLLLKDGIEAFFVILGVLFLIKIIKKFTWYNFAALYLAMFCATHFRFYIGYALIITFILCWFLFANINLKKRIIYGIIFIIIL
jgi:hypothetical protein